eukprot:TRINITY_DN8344_c0_g1_i17.p1 TRINITY_DN8344_c0_g1~~TRINITY_DN8344_c0_g1_i17.p1  ORF type:complete len:681 (-),score=167.09 TRINITY_DN8344_c0_g1_i17:390-2432(-)
MDDVESTAASADSSVEESVEESVEKRKVGSKTAKPRKTSMTYKQMIILAISAENKRKGSSTVAINKYLESNFDLPSTYKNYTKIALRRGVEDGTFVRVAASYKLSPETRKTLSRKKGESSTPRKKTSKATGSSSITTKGKSPVKGTSPVKEKTPSKRDAAKKGVTKTRSTESAGSKPSKTKTTTEKTSTKETTPKKPAKETPKKPTKETPKKPTKETPKKPTKETPKKPTKETPKKPTKETPKKPTKETPKKPTKETPKKPAKEPIKPSKETPTNPKRGTHEMETDDDSSDESLEAPIRKVTSRSKETLGSGEGKLEVSSMDKVTIIKQAKKGKVSLGGRSKPVLRKSTSLFIERAGSVTHKNTRIEIVFSFDTTGSMYGALEDVRKHITELATTLMGDLPGLRIAVIAHGDYEQGSKEPYICQQLDFTKNPTEIVDFVKSVQRTSGGDNAECYELVLRTVQKLSWSDGYSHNLVMIGDAPPHKKGNKYDDLDWEEELEALKTDFDIRIYSVQWGSGDEADKFFQALADRTSGVKLELSQFNKMKEMFLGLCYREATEQQYQQHTKEINSIARSSSAQLLLPVELNEEKVGVSDEDILKIHQAIHDTTRNSVTIDKTDYDISVGEAGCRFVRLNNGVVFIEQNKEKDTKYARLAAEGQLITWICHSGRWGLVVDKEIVRK